MRTLDHRTSTIGLALLSLVVAACGASSTPPLATPSTPAAASSGPSATPAPSLVPIDPGSVPVEAPLAMLWEGAGEDAESLAHPAIDPDGRIWVGVFDRNVFWMFDRDGTFIDSWDAGSATAESGHFGGIAFGRDGRIYVADAAKSRVLMFDADRKPLGEWGTFGDGPNEFITANAIATDAQGNVYVHDDADGAIKRFDPDGVSLGQFRVPGYPSIFPAGDGHVYAVTSGMILTEFAPDGTPIRGIDVRDHVDFAIGIRVDDAGNIWLGSNHETATGVAPDRLLQFGPDGKLRHDWEGMPVDGFVLDPSGDRLYVTMYGRGTLIAYEVPTP
jgi:sugar lactone lactonase YvrE